MPILSSIGAGIYSDLAIATPTAELSSATLNGLNTAAAFQALFATEIPSNGGTRAANTFTRVTNVRSFPSIGVPANIVNVATYGKATANQVQGQADIPALELTLNYVLSDWSAGALLGLMVGDGVQRVFRFTLLNSQPTGTGATQFASTVGGLGLVQNAQYYWVGKVEALLLNPQLTDANTATLTLSVQSAYFGAFTV